MTPDSAQDQWTVRKILFASKGFLEKHGSDSPRLDAEILLAHVRDCKRIELYTQIDEELSEDERAQMRELIKRRANAEPVAYLVGHREFYSLDFKVTPDVLIPRPDTETVVMAALEWLADHETPRIYEPCTGSGCIAVAIAKNAEAAHVIASDISSAAIDIATENATTHDVADRIEFRTGDMLNVLSPDEQFDLIISNPPYIASADMATLDRDVKDHEPHLALESGQDGLVHIRQLLDQAPPHLRDGGRLLFEHGFEQGAAVRSIVEQHAEWEWLEVLQDIAGHDRATIATRPSR